MSVTCRSNRRGPSNKRKKPTNTPTDDPIPYEYHPGGYNFFDNRLNSSSRSSRLRLWYHNLDKLGINQSERIDEELQVIVQTGMNTICLQDLSTPKPAWSHIITKARHQMADNYLTAKYARNEEKGNPGHGVAMILRDQAARRILSWVEDSRGWGRWIGALLQGSQIDNDLNEANDDDPDVRQHTKQLLIITFYLPPIKSKERDCQEEKLKASSCLLTAYEVALAEISAAIIPLLTPDTTLIIMGDVNAAWNLQNRRSPTLLRPQPLRRHNQLTSWADTLGVTNVLDDFMTSTYSTYHHPGQSFSDDKDVILISSHHAETTTLAVGVLLTSDTKNIINSLHRPICVEIDAAQALGFTQLDMEAQRYQVNPGVIRPGIPEEMLERYEANSDRMWVVNRFHERIKRLASSIPSLPRLNKMWD